MEKNKTNKARELLVEMFLDSLSNDKLNWKKGWAELDTPINPITNKKYRGINYLQLSFVASTRGYEDPRWCTFKQAEKNGWRIKKGEHGTPIEFWSLYDKENKKTVTIREYNYIVTMEGEERRDDFIWMNKVSTVFNACQIDLIPELIKNEEIEIEVDDFIGNLIENMNLSVIDGLEASYSPKLDKVYMPSKDKFYSIYDYNATLLHELSHATSHESRLNRKISTEFGSAEYAKEELRAEISSAFVSSELKIGSTKEHLENHAAYVSSWIETINKDHNELFRAIKDATDISEYIFKIGELHLFKEMEQTETSLDIKSSAIVNKKTIR